MGAHRFTWRRAVYLSGFAALVCVTLPLCTGSSGNHRRLMRSIRSNRLDAVLNYLAGKAPSAGPQTTSIPAPKPQNAATQEDKPLPPGWKRWEDATGATVYANSNDPRNVGPKKEGVTQPNHPMSRRRLTNQRLITIPEDNRMIRESHRAQCC